jgi:Flp pilus assembly protein TadD
MRYRLILSRAVLAALLVTAWAGVASAQSGRLFGTVADEDGKPIKGATVTVQNPNATPSTFKATTDDKGRWAMLGLRSGGWAYMVEAPGYETTGGQVRVEGIGNPRPINTKMKKAAGMAGLAANAKDLQADLAAADQKYNAKQWDEAIAAYKAILEKAPALHVINLQIAQCYRNKKDYDDAIAAYNELLKADPNNDKAKIGIGMTELEKGDMAAAEKTLTEAAQGVSASKELLYSLAEVKFAKGETDEAATWYQKAADLDPAWGKPWFKLGLVALNKGDKAQATQMMQKVIDVDPTSPEAAQAKAVIAQLQQ